MQNEKLLRMVTAAALAALTCVATMVVSVPIPATKGYFNLGDSIVLLCGVFLGRLFGGFLFRLRRGFLSGFPSVGRGGLGLAATGGLLLRRGAVRPPEGRQGMTKAIHETKPPVFPQGRRWFFACITQRK